MRGVSLSQVPTEYQANWILLRLKLVSVFYWFVKSKAQHLCKTSREKLWSENNKLIQRLAISLIFYNFCKIKLHVLTDVCASTVTYWNSTQTIDKLLLMNFTSDIKAWKIFPNMPIIFWNPQGFDSKQSLKTSRFWCSFHLICANSVDTFYIRKLLIMVFYLQITSCVNLKHCVCCLF